MIPSVPLSDILNSFVDSAIVIQEEGQIIATNSVWDEFTSRNHGNLGATGIGANYLEIYKNRFEGDLHKAQQAYYGILSVIERKLKCFQLEYPCYYEEQEKWFILRATPIQNDESLTLILHIDITQRKLYELERETILRQQKKENDIRRVGEELAKLVIWEWDANTKKINISENAFKLYGVKPAEFDGSLKSVMNIVHPSERTKIYKCIKKIIAQKKSELYEFRVLLPNKEVKIVRGTCKMHFDKNGQIIKLIGVSQDVTEQRIIEQQLKKSETQFKSAFENAPIGMALVSPVGQWLMVNKALCGMVGYTEKELLQIDFQTITHPEDLDVDLAYVQQMLDGSIQSYEMEKRYFHKEGYIVWIQLNVSLVRNEQQQPLHFISQIQNITQKKQHEEQLNKLALVTKHTDNAVIITDKNGKIEWTNEGFTRITEYTLDEVIGKKPGVFLQGAETSKDTLLKITKARKAKKSIKTEIINYKKSGSKMWMHLNIHPIIDQYGQIERFFSIQRDITKQKEVEQAIQRHNDELTKTNQELDNFVYSVSHDLRAPIASSLGLIELIGSETDQNEIQKLLLLQKKSLQKLDNYIQDILNYSRNARLQVEVEPIDIEELVREILAQFSYLYERNKIEITIHIEGNSTFYSDKRRLMIIFNNLFSNAIRFFNPYQEEPYIKLSATINAEQVMMSVSDNGIGIEEKHLNKIFEMFYRATDVKPGSGLGLYIVYESVKKLNGKVEVSSKFNSGTTVNLTLPNLASK